MSDFNILRSIRKFAGIDYATNKQKEDNFLKEKQLSLHNQYLNTSPTQNLIKYSTLATSSNVFNITNNVDSLQSVDIETILKEGYYANASVYAIINKISTISSNFYYKIKSKDNKKIPNELEYLIKKTNKNQTFADFMQLAIKEYLLTGSIYILKTKTIGYKNVSSLEILASQFIEPILEDKDDLRSNIVSYKYTAYKNVINYNADEIISIINPNLFFNSTKGVPDFYAAWNSILSSNSVAKAERFLLDNKGAVGLLINKGDYILTDTERERIEKSLDSRSLGVDKFAKTLTANGDLEYIDVGKSPKDLDISNLELNSLRRICNAFNVSSQLFNDPANSTYNNIESAEKSLYTNNVIPIVDRVIDAINFDLFFNTNYEIAVGYEHIEVLQSDKLKELQKSKLQLEIMNTILDTANSKDDAKTKMTLLLKEFTEVEIDALLVNFTQKNEQNLQQVNTQPTQPIQ